MKKIIITTLKICSGFFGFSGVIILILKNICHQIIIIDNLSAIIFIIMGILFGLMALAIKKL